MLPAGLVVGGCAVVEVPEEIRTPKACASGASTAARPRPRTPTNYRLQLSTL